MLGSQLCQWFSAMFLIHGTFGDRVTSSMVSFVLLDRLPHGNRHGSCGMKTSVSE
ncbi:hypothetical protein KC19_8G116600 [Ceratodon purpureus]|uniref:Uncharacterized protein n=1 Tax=Ceratodon purpureus TaxID=3225 RepID=A0A8T0H2E5_CERPU|nr:hypothetical protein KC19_8G115900 [Ceratodon purpureus]KAG0564514.1 hypothetical protein KC19_8G116600 [Ceratodon purpureus]